MIFKGKKKERKLQAYFLGSCKCRLLPKGRGKAEAEHCYEAGRGGGLISKDPVPQCLSEQSSAGEVQLRVQMIRQAHSSEVKLESQASKSGSGSAPERVNGIIYHLVIAQHIHYDGLGLR